MPDFILFCLIFAFIESTIFFYRENKSISLLLYFCSVGLTLWLIIACTDANKVLSVQEADIRYGRAVFTEEIYEIPAVDLTDTSNYQKLDTNHLAIKRIKYQKYHYGVSLLFRDRVKYTVVRKKLYWQPEPKPESPSLPEELQEIEHEE